MANYEAHAHENSRSRTQHAVANSGGVRGVQMHPPLAASNVFWRT